MRWKERKWTSKRGRTETANPAATCRVRLSQHDFPSRLDSNLTPFNRRQHQHQHDPGPPPPSASSSQTHPVSLWRLTSNTYPLLCSALLCPRPHSFLSIYYICPFFALCHSFNSTNTLLFNNFLPSTRRCVFELQDRIQTRRSIGLQRVGKVTGEPKGTERLLVVARRLC